MKKFSYTFFFGYSSFKYRRLIRTPIILLSIILILSGIISGLDYQSPNKKLIKEIYNDYPLYVTPSREYFSVKESQKKWPDSLNYFLDNQTLKDFNISYEEFYELLWFDDELIETICRNINEGETYSNCETYYFRRYNLGLIDMSERFRLLTDMSIVVLCILSFTFLLSFLIEPFILEKKNLNDKSGLNQIKTKIEVSKDKPFDNKFNEVSIQNRSSNNNLGIVNYFYFNNEYISGQSYLNRMLVGSMTTLIFGLGILLMLSAIYKRSKSLKFGNKLTIINCVTITTTILSSYFITLISSEVLKLYLVMLLIILIPHFILIFKNGKRDRIELL
jgi:hypothetical protein